MQPHVSTRSTTPTATNGDQIPMNRISKFMAFLLTGVLLNFVVDTATQAQDSDAVQRSKTVRSMVETLEKDAQKFTGVMKELQVKITGKVEEIKHAEKRFDKMIQLIKEAAATYGPDSDYVKKIEALIDEARKSAAKARRKKLMPLAAEFDKDVAAFKTFKERAVAIYRDSETSIASIKEQKDVFVLYHQKKLFDDAKEVLKKGESAMAAYADKLKGTGDAVKVQAAQ